MTDPYRQHNSDGLIASLSEQVANLKAELTTSENKVKELEQTVDDERAAINTGWEYKLVHIPHDNGKLGSSSGGLTLRIMLTIRDKPWMKGRKVDDYIIEYENLVLGQLATLGKQGWEMFHQDAANTDIYWFRRTIKVK